MDRNGIIGGLCIAAGAAATLSWYGHMDRPWRYQLKENPSKSINQTPNQSEYTFPDEHYEDTGAKEELAQTNRTKQIKPYEEKQNKNKKSKAKSKKQKKHSQIQPWDFHRIGSIKQTRHIRRLPRCA
jgi:hypothetical protein